MPAGISPTSDAQRLASLDILRGFALLGILTMNIGVFSMPVAAYFAPTVYGSLTGIDGWVWRITHVFADMKFMAIFSMLFGAGIVLITQRAESRGDSATGLHYRRMAWLALFGLMHAHLLWHGDILFWYGICGMVVFLFRNLQPKWLICWGLVSIAITSAIMISTGLSADNWPPGMLEYINADLKPPPPAIASEIAAYQGGWLDQMRERVPKALEMQTSTLLFWAFWRVSGLMLLGMALFKLGVMSANRSKNFYLTFIALAIAVGIPVILFGMRYQFAIDWAAPQFFFIGTQFNYWGSLFVGLGWLSFVMLFCQSDALASVKSALAAVGRMAFTNYIMQTVICTTIFYGHGFGLFGQIDRAGQVAIVVAVWVFQIALSVYWLRRFRFGPLEWLWRSLTYWERQPFKLSEKRV